MISHSIENADSDALGDDSVGAFAGLPVLISSSGLARKWGIHPSQVSKLVSEGRLNPVCVVVARYGRGHENGGMLLFDPETPRPVSAPRGKVPREWEQWAKDRAAEVAEHKRRNLLGLIRQGERDLAKGELSHEDMLWLQNKTKERTERYIKWYGALPDRVGAE